MLQTQDDTSFGVPDQVPVVDKDSTAVRYVEDMVAFTVFSG